jgi:predicted O-methyltransferase YrrM
MNSGCRGELVAVEYMDLRFEELRANTATLSEIAGSTVRVTATHMEGLEYLSKLEDESLDILFVDVEKNLYPEVLRMSRRKLRGGGIAVFHNAIAPRLLDELFEIARREFKPLIIPSSAGLLVAYRS